MHSHCRIVYFHTSCGCNKKLLVEYAEQAACRMSLDFAIKLIPLKNYVSAIVVTRVNQWEK